MDKMEIVTFLVLVTLVSGGIGYGIWKILEKFLGEKYPKMCYLMLKVVSIFLFFPIIACAVLLFHPGNSVDGSIFKSVFWMSIAMERVAKVGLFIWGVCCLRELWKKWKSSRAWEKIQKQSRYIDCYDEIAKKVQKTLGLKKEISIYENTMISSPMICGVLCPRILIPNKVYSGQEVEMILFHEMSHYKNKDLSWKCFLRNALIFHGINPFQGMILNSLDEWGEICCDLTVSEYAKESFSMKSYYFMILEQISEMQESVNINTKYVAGLFEKKSEIRKRITIIQKQRKGTKMKKVKERGIGIIFLLIFVSTLYFSGVSIEAASDYVLNQTSDEIIIDNTNEENVEEDNYVEIEEEVGSVELGELKDKDSRTINSMEWIHGIW